jgi:hypothetical protein
VQNRPSRHSSYDNLKANSRIRKAIRLTYSSQVKLDSRLLRAVCLAPAKEALDAIVDYRISSICSIGRAKARYIVPKKRLSVS